MDPLSKIHEEDLAALTSSENPEQCFEAYKDLLAKRGDFFDTVTLDPTGCDLHDQINSLALNLLKLANTVDRRDVIRAADPAAFVDERVARISASVSEKSKPTATPDKTTALQGAMDWPVGFYFA